MLVVVALMCISYFGYEDDAALHVFSGTALLVVLAMKVAVVRRGGGASRLLPLLGVSVFALLALTWLSSAGGVLAGGLTMSDPSHARQMLGSLLVALTIVVVVIVAVTLRLGPTSVAELEAMQERGAAHRAPGRAA